MIVYTDEEKRNLYEQFLKCIDREENLIHYRLTWGLQWNTACFAMYLGLASSGLPKHVVVLLSFVVCGFGIAISVLSLIGVLAAHKQTEYLITDLTRRLDIQNENWISTKFLRPYGDRNDVHPTARKISRWLPSVAVVFWIGLLMYAVWELGRA